MSTSQPTPFPQALATALFGRASHVFALMGNGNAHLIDALEALSMPLTTVRHEAATVASADAYYRVSGKLAIATTTYGAGFTNTLTALAEAAQARTPLLLVVGDAPTTGKRPWDIDQEMSAAAVGVRSYELGLTDIDASVEHAVTAALQQRRPVVLSIPYDLAAALILGAPTNEPEVDLDPASLPLAITPVTEAGETAALSASTGESVIASSPELSRAAQILATAKRPLVLAGHGAWLAGASEELGAIASRLGALTASTALARGIFPAAEYDLGLTGGFGQEAAMHTITEADVVLVVGASLNQFTMRFGELFSAGAHVIRIDLDEALPPKTTQPIEYLLLRGDARELLTSLLRLLGDRTEAVASWRESIAGLEPGGALRQLDRGSQHPGGLCPDGKLDPRNVAARIAELLPEDRHVTSDGGHFIGWANMYWPVASPERMIMVGTAYQSIGLGLATAAGVAAAAPSSTVVITTGDGGGLMALADLETAIRVSDSCVIVVWNDGAYGAEVHLYGEMGLNQQSMMIPEVNFAGLASALGAEGVVVETLEDLDALKQWRAAGAKGTILLDCRISRSVVAPYQREIQRANGLRV